jgi:hypothetical protein
MIIGFVPVYALTCESSVAESSAAINLPCQRLQLILITSKEEALSIVYKGFVIS